MQQWFLAHYDFLKDFAGPFMSLAALTATVAIAVKGFNTLEKWKKQRIEEKRLDVAWEMLSITYESKYVFDHIRTSLIREPEWAGMPIEPGESDDDRRRRGSYYAVLKRISDQSEFFERLFKLQPKCMAVLGSAAEDVFVLLHKARREIEVSAEMLAWEVHNPARGTPSYDPDFWKQCRRDVADHGDFEKDKDRVGKKLDEFRIRAEALCRPIVENKYRPPV